MISIPLHQDPQLPVAAMALMRTTYQQQLIDRATLAFTMVNLADAAGRKRMIKAPKDTVFGSFRPSFINERLKAAFPKDEVVPQLTPKQARRQQIDEEYRASFAERNTVSLTNYEQGQWHRNSGNLDERAGYIGCRKRFREQFEVA